MMAHKRNSLLIVEFASLAELLIIEDSMPQKLLFSMKNSSLASL